MHQEANEMAIGTRFKMSELEPFVARASSASLALLSVQVFIETASRCCSMGIRQQARCIGTDPVEHFTSEVSICPTPPGARNALRSQALPLT